MIEFIKKVKAKINNKKYTSLQLQDDFYKILTISNVCDVYNDDLSEYENVLIYLIAEVLDIYQSEESSINKNLLANNLSLNNLKDRIEDKKRANNIYLFNNKKPKYIIGDIHSDSISLKTILDKVEFFDKIVKNEDFSLIFLGDYVDRGKTQLKTILFIILLKYLFPDYIYLLKGNHDQGWLENNKVMMGVRKPEKDLSKDWFMLYLEMIYQNNDTFSLETIKSIIKFFDNLATLAFILGDKNILLSHGGIPRPKRDKKDNFRYIERLSDLSNENIVDEIGSSIILNMLWSDPTNLDEDNYSHTRRFEFTEKEYNEFREHLDFDLLIRGHQVQIEGYKYFFNDNILNIFSSGSIFKDGININDESAYLIVNPHIVLVNNDDISVLSLNA